jgi:ATP-dependent Lon protease
LIAQRELAVDEPTPDDLYTVGVVARMTESSMMPDGTVRITLEGTARVRILEYLLTEPYFRVRVEQLPDIEEEDLNTAELVRIVIDRYDQAAQTGRISTNMRFRNQEERYARQPGFLSNAIAPYLNLPVEQEQELLENLSPRERLEKVNAALA